MLLVLHVFWWCFNNSKQNEKFSLANLKNFAVKGKLQFWSKTPVLSFQIKSWTKQNCQFSLKLPVFSFHENHENSSFGSKLEFWFGQKTLDFLSFKTSSFHLKTASFELFKEIFRFYKIVQNSSFGRKTQVLVWQRAFEFQIFSKFQNSQFSLITASFEL